MIETIRKIDPSQIRQGHRIKIHYDLGGEPILDKGTLATEVMEIKSIIRGKNGLRDLKLVYPGGNHPQVIPEEALIKGVHGCIVFDEVIAKNG